MIGSVSSNYSSYYSSSSSTSSVSRGQPLHQELFAKLDSNGDGAVDQDELNSALSQKGDNGILVGLSKHFSDLDSDRNGSLSSDEMAAMAPPPRHDQAPNTELADALLSALDSDGDGAISHDELSSGLSSAGSSADSKQVFSALDKNQDGNISIDELAASLAPPPAQQVSGTPLFSQLDSDGDGSISAGELSTALQTGDNSTSTDNSAALLKILDSDNSGGISSDELKAALQAGRSSNGNRPSDSSAMADALDKLIASLNQQYQLTSSSRVGSSVNVAA